MSAVGAPPLPSKRLVCVISTQRSGSTWFLQMLNALPGVRAYGEVFNAGATREHFAGAPELRPPMFFGEMFPSLRTSSNLAKSSMPWLAAKYVRYLDALQNAADDPVIAVKVMYNHINMSMWAGLLARRPCFIHFVRRNSLEGMISGLVARQRKKFHSVDDEVLEPTLYADPTVLLSGVRRRERRKALAECLISMSLHKHMAVYYEDMCEDEAYHMARVSAFVAGGKADTPQRTGDGQLRKINSIRYIKNLDEIRAYFEKTPYRHMIPRH